MDFIQAVKAMKEGKKVRRQIKRFPKKYITCKLLDEEYTIFGVKRETVDYYDHFCFGMYDFEATDWQIVEEKKKCAFCQKEGNWINVLRDTSIMMKDGSDVILCDECLTHYANQDYDKIKVLKPKAKEKNTLSDKIEFIETGSHSADGKLKAKDVKEAIKEYAKSLCENAHFDDSDREFIRGLAKEIFGERLI